MQEPFIRPFRPGDRPAVRTIVCNTADRGEPVEHFFQDREVFADLLSRYYTDWEPTSLWVAEHDGRVIGYLTGCMNNPHYYRIMTWRIIPAAVLRALFRGLLFRPETRRLGRAAIKTWQSGQWRHTANLENYPSHLHLNIERAFRGQRIGEHLVTRFLQQLKTAGVPGTRATVRGDNPAACRFFERMGFTVLGRAQVAFPPGDASEFHEKRLYGKRL